MFELFCKISFFLFMLVMYTYVTSTGVVAIIILGYILCVFSYYYFHTIKTAIDEFLNYVQNHGIPKTTISPPQVPNYPINKKYNKVVTNSVNVPSMNNKVFVPFCRNNKVFSSNTPAVFNCKFNNFILNGDLSSPLMRNGLSVENCNRSRDKMKLPMHNMNQSFNNSSALRFRNNSQSGHNPFTACKKYNNNNLDMETYLNVKSPGFTGRIVDKALESASYHIKYPAVKQISAYRFDKSTLRHFSKVPRMNSTPVVRIAPPEPISLHLLNDIEKKLDKNETKEQNFLHALKDSRKRNYSQEGGNEKSNGTVKKSRKNDIKNFTISQYKRSLEDKSRDVLEDNGKRRCDNYNRDATKMVVYAPSLALSPNISSNTYSKKRKSSKSDKSKNECAESTEKYRRIGNSPRETSTTDYSNEAKPQSYDLKSYDSSSVNESKLVDVPDQRLKHAENESIEDENDEYVRVASGKILNRTNRLYRRKLNSNKIDPVSVIASEPEVVGKITGTDDVAMKEHLLQNLLSHIEKKGHSDEKVVFYENSILEEVSKTNSQYDEPPQQVPNPLFTDSVVPNVDEIEMNDLTNDGLNESTINFAHLPSNKSATCAVIHHSTPVTSNTRNSIKGANHVTSSNAFGSASLLTSIKNGPNFADSGYGSPNSEPSISNSASYNQPFSFGQKSAFASTNGFNNIIQQSSAALNSESNSNMHFGNNSSSLGSGDGNYFNPSNIRFNSSNDSRSTSYVGNKSDNYNFGAKTLNLSHTFGSKDGRTSMQCEPSFSSIVSNSQENSVFGNGNLDSVVNAGFSIGAGENFKNFAARTGRNRNYR